MSSFPLLPCDKDFGDTVVRVVDVSKHYKIAGREDEVVTALHGISLELGTPYYPIRQGEFVMLRGASGGGKTTLLNLIGTIDAPSSGTLHLFGETITADSSDGFLSALRLDRIGFVFQTFNLLATMSAFENVELPMTMLGKLTRTERRARAAELLRMVGLHDRMDHLPSELSGGEQQRVTVARALANKPDLLLADEPTGDLDTKNTIEVMDMLLDINQKEGLTVLMVTHNPDLECYADRILYLQDGCLAKQAVNTTQSRLVYENYVKVLAARQ